MEITMLDPSFGSCGIELNANEREEEICNKVHAYLNNSVFLEMIKLTAWKKISNIASETNISKSSVLSIFENEGFREILHNSATRMYERCKEKGFCGNLGSKDLFYAKLSAQESSSFVRTSRISWEQGIFGEIEAIGLETKKKIVSKKPSDWINPFLDFNKDTVSIQEPIDGIDDDLPQMYPVESPPHILNSDTHNENIRFLYDGDDFLEALLNIRNPNSKACESRRCIGLIQVTCSDSPDLNELQRRFADLSPQFVQIGLDESVIASMNNRSLNCSKILANWHEEAEAISSFGTIMSARKLLRRGVVHSARAKLYRIALGLENAPCDIVNGNATLATNIEVRSFDSLRDLCDKVEYLSDELFMHDVQTVIDESKFFVFEEELKEVSLCFSRDFWVREFSTYQIHQLVVNNDLQDSAKDEEYLKVMSPSGVYPFHGLSLYNAPLCYLYRHKPTLYSVCRQMYAKLWCRLNVISLDLNSILPLCYTFETLLFECCPKLFLHLVRIGVQPLRIAFPWIHSAFIHVLEIDQLLVLWDRMLGYMDLNILVIFAVAIFMTRADPLLQCTNPVEANIIIQETSRLKVVPLLQMILYADKNT